jgi:uncharacterized protein (DUF2236 family)
VVAGGSRRRHPLTSTDAAGLYGPGSAAWAGNRDAFLLLGAGPRALLLQLAHPLVAEGVAQHSDFRDDPWSRLASTLRSYLRIIYASRAGAHAEISRLNLPASIRAGYEIPWSPLRGAVAGWLVAGWRGWAALLPDAWGTMPQARAADRRITSALTGHARAR